MESTPAENTRLRACSDRTLSTQSLADAAALDATMVRAPSPAVSELLPRDARPVETTLQLPLPAQCLPAPTPDAADRRSPDRRSPDRRFPDRDFFNPIAPAPTDLQPPVSADPTLRAILGFMSLIQSTLLFQSVARQVEARNLDRKFEEMNKRFEALETARSDLAAAGVSAPRETKRVVRHSHPTELESEDRSPTVNASPRANALLFRSRVFLRPSCLLSRPHRFRPLPRPRRFRLSSLTCPRDRPRVRAAVLDIHECASRSESVLVSGSECSACVRISASLVRTSRGTVRARTLIDVCEPVLAAHIRGTCCRDRCDRSRANRVECSGPRNSPES